MKRLYRRHLPHQIPENTPIFVTWNLKGSLPAEVRQQIHQERERLRRLESRPGESRSDRKIREEKLLFAMTDRFLDSLAAGPMDLKDPRAAAIVEEALVAGVPARYDLFAWCVMGNHVHAVLKPFVEWSAVMQRLKGSTAFRINGLNKQRGRIFWQDESYDHWPRGEEELLRIIEYVEQNPVAAGLCARAADWRWSSARHRTRWIKGMPFVRQASAGPT
jgi:REP element-mobilizing transposase RayT